jgi:predicted 3-demethylubiquinone-9 3-methyltransferase (glyoxalase superfamily)
MQPIRITLWFDSEAEEAAHFYTSIFRDAKLGNVVRYPETGQEFTGKAPGSVMFVEFELNGQPFVALNGGPLFTFTEAISLEVDAADQDEIDYYWERLGEGGDPDAQQCGWLKDRFGVSWQVVPRAVLEEVLGSGDQPSIERAYAAMFPMKKLDIAALRRAHAGG